MKIDIEQWANSRETSYEIADAIFRVATNEWIKQADKDENTILDIADWIYDEGMHYREVLHIAFKLSTEDELYWGEETFERDEECFWS
tara:strand:- start:85 stop:348 length:264 start_codon:yes stop_codon:yes gene_type:complete